MDAVRLAQRAVALNPPTGQAYIVLAKAEIAVGDLFNSARHLLEAINLGAPKDEVFFVRALISKQVNNTIEAKTALAKVIDVSSATELKAIAGIELGDILQNEGNLDDAEHQYRSAASLQSCTKAPERRLAALLVFGKNLPSAAKGVLTGLDSTRARIANARLLEVINFFECSQESVSQAVKNEKLRSLLQQSEVSVDEIVLTAAQFNTGKQLIVDLLAAGILQNVDAVDGHSNTALLVAANGNAGEVAKELVIRGARVNTPNASGERAIGLFAARGNMEIVKLLLKKGAEINYVDGKGNSPLSLAIAGSHSGTAKLLLQRGAKANLAELLTRAAFSGNLSMVQMLVDMGGEVNSKEERSPPPLISAIISRDLPTIRYLLDRGADPSVTFNGKSSYEYALDVDTPAISKLLSEKKKVRL